MSQNSGKTSPAKITCKKATQKKGKNYNNKLVKKVKKNKNKGFIITVRYFDRARFV